MSQQDVSMGVSRQTYSRQTYSRDVTMQSVSQISKMHTRRQRSPLLGKVGPAVEDHPHLLVCLCKVGNSDNIHYCLQASSPGRSGASQSYQAPTGLTDSDDDSDGATPSFSIKAPTGYSGRPCSGPSTLGHQVCDQHVPLQHVPRSVKDRSDVQRVRMRMVR